MRYHAQGGSGAIIVMRTPGSGEMWERKPPIREAISIKILILYQIFFINGKE